RQALIIQRQLVTEFPNEPEFDKQFAQTHRNLGRLFYTLRKLADAQAEYQEAVEILEKLAIRFPNVPEYNRDLAATCNNIGLAYSADRRNSRKAILRAISIVKQLAAQFPAQPDFRHDLGRDYLNLGLVTDPDEAEDIFSQSVSILSDLCEDFP